MARQQKQARTSTQRCPRCSKTVVRVRRQGKWVWRHLVIDVSNAHCFFKAEGKVWDEAWS